MTGARPKVVVVMPAYNAARTLHMTYADLPHQMVDLVILVDDGSTDETTRIARELGLELFIHNRNYGYGANQKTCYREALKAGFLVGAIPVVPVMDKQFEAQLPGDPGGFVGTAVIHQDYQIHHLVRQVGISHVEDLGRILGTHYHN